MSSPSENPLKNLLREAHRRSLWQVLGIYVMASWVVFEVVETLTDGLGLPDWFPAFAIVLLLIGLPIVLATAFVQEGGPAVSSGGELSDLEGILSSDGESEREARATRRLLTWKNAILGGVGGFALWGVVAAAWVLLGSGISARSSSGEGDVRLRSIAVLPFQNLSEDGPHAYFAGGLHDELLTQLAKVEALTVMGRTSVMAYVDTDQPLGQIADELGVGSLVEGSVQVQGDRLRVTVQLLDAETGGDMWAERYDRTLEDAFAVQSEIARRIVEEVGAETTASEASAIGRAPTDNDEAYRLYLQGEEYKQRPGFLPTNLEIAEEQFERAIELDPDFALARARLSDVHSELYWFRHDPSAERAQQMREEAEAALRLAPDLPQAHVAMGMAHYRNLDYSRALEELEIALEGLPNDAELWYNLGAVRRRMGHWDEAIAAFERASQLDARNALVFYDIGGATYWVTHRYPEALRAFDRAHTLAPDLHVAALDKGTVYLVWRGQLDTLRAVLDRMPPNEYLGVRAGSATRERARLLLFERRADSLLSLLSTSHRRVMRNEVEYLPTSLYRAWAHRLRGDRAAARRALESALALLDSALTELPDDWRVHGARGLTLAGLGRREEAVREADWLKESKVYRKDAFFRPMVRNNRAHILAEVGDAEAALDEIDRLVEGPSFWVTAQTLRLDPLWDPIREHPRFQGFLEGSGITR